MWLHVQRCDISSFETFQLVRDIQGVAALAQQSLPCHIEMVVRYLQGAFRNGDLFKQCRLISALTRYISLCHSK